MGIPSLEYRMEQHVEMMNELIEEGMAVLKELFDEEVKPLIDYRADIEKKIANQAIKEMYMLEREA